jgi:hypothetical protein
MLLVVVAALLVGGFALIDQGTRLEAARLRATDTKEKTDDGSSDDGDPALPAQDL